jgi:protein required for attachment to host cells
MAAAGCEVPLGSRIGPWLVLREPAGDECRTRVQRQSASFRDERREAKGDLGGFVGRHDIAAARLVPARFLASKCIRADSAREICGLLAAIFRVARPPKMARLDQSPGETFREPRRKQCAGRARAAAIPAKTPPGACGAAFATSRRGGFEMKLCVVVADRSRARLFVSVKGAERHGAPGRQSELREIEALTDPEGEIVGAELFSSAHSGSNRSPHGAQFSYDEHRERHRDEEERRFAQRVAGAVHSRLDAETFDRLVLAVEPRLLGLLRRALNGSLGKSVEIVEMAKDLSRHTPEQIREALARSGVIPN